MYGVHTVTGEGFITLKGDEKSTVRHIDYEIDSDGEVTFRFEDVAFAGQLLNQLAEMRHIGLILEIEEKKGE